MKGIKIALTFISGGLIASFWWMVAIFDWFAAWLLAGFSTLALVIIIVWYIADNWEEEK